MNPEGYYAKLQAFHFWVRKTIWTTITNPAPPHPLKKVLVVSWLVFFERRQILDYKKEFQNPNVNIGMPPFPVTLPSESCTGISDYKKEYPLWWPHQKNTQQVHLYFYILSPIFNPQKQKTFLKTPITRTFLVGRCLSYPTPIPTFQRFTTKVQGVAQCSTQPSVRSPMTQPSGRFIFPSSPDS